MNNPTTKSDSQNSEGTDQNATNEISKTLESDWGGKIEEHSFNNWADVKKFASNLTGWSFRGQRTANWDLMSSLERAIQLQGWPRNLITLFENMIIRSFQRRAYQYASDTPPQNELLEWLALLQHYGGSTRLVDFTYSFYVAAFFALEEADSDSAIWCLNNQRFLRENPRIMQSLLLPGEPLRRPLGLDPPDVTKIVNEIIKPFPYRGFKGEFSFLCEPQQMNERSGVQQGLFLFICDPTKSSQASMLSSLKKDEYVLKLILRPSVRRQALLEFKKMNISRASLFPGLEGFARSLSLAIPQSP